MCIFCDKDPICHLNPKNVQTEATPFKNQRPLYDFRHDGTDFRWNHCLCRSHLLESSVVISSFFFVFLDTSAISKCGINICTLSIRAYS